MVGDKENKSQHRKLRRAAADDTMHAALAENIPRALFRKACL